MTQQTYKPNRLMKEGHDSSKNRMAVRVACLLMGLAMLPASAALVYNENFESFNTGTLDSQGGFSAGSAYSVVSGGLEYANGDILIPGGAKSMKLTGSNTSGNDSFNVAMDSAVTSETFYFSVVLNLTSAGQDTFLWYGVSDSSKGSPLKNSAGFVKNSGSTLRVGPRISEGNDSSDHLTGAGTFSTDANTLLVGRVVPDGLGNYNTVSLEVNPSSSTEPAWGYTTSQTTNLPTFDSIFFRIGGSDRIGSGDLYLDSLRVGDSWDSVTAIPEPASLMLFASIAVLAARRHLRSAGL